MKRDGIKLRAGRWLFHVKIKRHGNATGLELYIGRLNEAHLQNAKVIKSRRQA